MPELRDKVEKALENIRPYLEADGGDVQVLEVDKNRNVILELLGSCGSCPVSAMTLKAGVEETIKKEVPEVNGIHAINMISPDDPDA